MRNAGKYVVEDKEGKGGKWIWRLVYEVEERKSLMGKPMLGERAFIPITFACSPEILVVVMLSDVWLHFLFFFIGSFFDLFIASFIYFLCFCTPNLNYFSS
ncbi:hypothetical protein PtA15_14A91 [Puccinia triticina]|uniref:Uncharacterized protein n=1 Tax=Puccinia triticina TaxID=208348 RepID=A0ABY7D1V3_9BASI|nr:uncharacterized protein PtA15_14A91 [Puccinia triticina]WAQ91210.1 hypothetical protein PtA15_14A91 [Puccinia triticina]